MQRVIGIAVLIQINNGHVASLPCIEDRDGATDADTATTPDTGKSAAILVGRSLV